MDPAEIKLAMMVREAKDHTDTMDVVAGQPLSKLRYTVAEASSYSGIYEPHNILYDRPQDLTSRWSGAAVASIAPNSSSSNASGSGGSNPPSSSVNRSSSPLTGTSRDGSGSGQGRGAGGITSTAQGPWPGDKQFIILKLERPSLVRKIHFGKYHKAHPCNLKDFKVYGSLSTKDSRSNSWVRILRGGLRNDSQTEVFDVRWTNSEGVPFPVRYIKLVPLATHSPNYNFSVWHIALEGIPDSYTVERVTREYLENRESMSIRLILKHLRSRAYHSAFRTLLQTSKLDARQGIQGGGSWSSLSPKRPFEHPLVTQLFNNLVQGAWDAAEECLERAAWGDLPHGGEGEEGVGARESVFSESSSGASAAVPFFSSYVERSMPKARWSQIVASDHDGDSPCGRGGHEMELDSEKGIIWLFGGWDGSKDLADLWAYYIQEGRWRCISRDTRNEGGPGPRSCHKMVFDPRTGFLYVLGKFVDYGKAATGTNVPGSFALVSHPPSLADTRRRSNTLDRQPSPSNTPTATTPATSTATATDAASATNRSATRGLFLPRVAPVEGTAQAGAPVSGTDPPRPGSPNRGGPSITLSTGYECDFYRFSTRTERWDRLSFDTHLQGGPKLVFDHQMVIDPETQLLYVFGGRVAHPDSSKVELSGMWKYDVIQRSWTFLFDDLTPAPSKIPSRVGHTMLLDTSKRGLNAGKRLIWVLAGQRNNQYMADMWTYQPSTGAVIEVSKDYSASNGPEGGFTQRATIDSNARELYMFSGLVKKSKNKGEKVKSAFWIYSIERADWRMVYQYGGAGSLIKQDGSEGDEEEGVEGGNGDEDTNMDGAEPVGGPLHAFPTTTANTALGYGLGMGAAQMGSPGLYSEASRARAGLGASEPRPRYAAQLMYDHKRKSFYIFGGNPADPLQVSLRLDDLWSLDLIRPSLSEVLRKAKFKLRQQRFLELANDQQAGLSGAQQQGAGWGAMQALVYLQTQVSQVVNHDVPEESQAFRKLMAHLLSASSSTEGSSPNASSSEFTFPSIFMPPTEAPSLAPTVKAAATPTEDGAAVPSDSDDVAEDDECEMLSISQVLPARSNTQQPPPFTLQPEQPSSLSLEGRSSSLYKQRYRLFKALLDFFPSDAIEPEVDLLDCIEISKLSF